MYMLKSLLTYKLSLICKYITLSAIILRGSKEFFGSKSVLDNCRELRNKEYKVVLSYCHTLQVYLGKSV